MKDINITTLSTITDAFNCGTLAHVAVDFQKRYCPNEHYERVFKRGKYFGNWCRQTGIPNFWIGLDKYAEITADSLYIVHPETDRLVTKSGASAFKKTTLQADLQPYDTILVSGVSAHHCVQFTIEDALQHDFNVACVVDITDLHLFDQSKQRAQKMYGARVLPVYCRDIRRALSAVKNHHPASLRIGNP